MVPKTDPVCSAQAMLVDIHTLEELRLTQEDIDTPGSTVVFSSEKLTLNRRYHVMITASNVNGSALSDIDEISKYIKIFLGCMHMVYTHNGYMC